MKYFLSYGVNMSEKANLKAYAGNIVHKSLELLAWKKLTEQRGEKEFTENECGKFHIKDIDLKSAVDISYQYHKEQNVFDIDNLSIEHPTNKKVMKIYDFCFSSTEIPLVFSDGDFSPLKRKIVEPERFFDFVIDKPWGKYDYTLPDGSNFSGQLGIRGTLDLVTEVDESTYELIDWKTGKKYDWNKGKDKEYADLQKDFQLLLYNYAAKKLYPGKDVILSIYYINAGGPCTIFFGKNDVEDTEKLVQKRFEEIKNCVKPKRMINTKDKWKCKYLCHFGKNTFKGETKDFKESICETVYTDLINLGMDKVIKKYGKDLTGKEYTGGGRKEVAVAK